MQPFAVSTRVPDPVPTHQWSDAQHPMQQYTHKPRRYEHLKLLQCRNVRLQLGEAVVAEVY